MNKNNIFIPLLASILIQFFLGCDFMANFVSDLNENFNDDMRSVQIDENRYMENLDYIAQWREPGSEHWQSVQDLCVQVFADNGFQIEKNHFENGVNIIGRLKGLEKPEESVIIGAHYDHIRYCNGADDNASGVAGVLEAAYTLGALGPFDRSLTLICFDQEEEDLAGSRAFVKEKKSSLSGLVTAYVFESIGYTSNTPNSQQVPGLFKWIFSKEARRIKDDDYRGDFIAIVANNRAREAVQLLNYHAENVGVKSLSFVPPVGLENIFGLAGLGRSDHFPFWLKKFPALMLTDTANHRNPNYHCVNGPDNIYSLNFEFATGVVNMTLRSAFEQLNNEVQLR